ncbi:MAG TPA: spermidine synthase [Burkholderiaceae bacterium]|nr:spermidine synthase [Burkholderiaceae bacterium]
MTFELPMATISEQDGIRYLHLGDTPWVQGAFAVRTPNVIVLAYVQRMLAALLWRPSEALVPRHAVQLGLGAATLTRFCHGVLRAPRVTAVEINPAVIAACRHGFRLPDDDARLSVVEADALSWVADAAQRGSVDLLHVDLYDHEAAAPVCDSERFYADCRATLAPGGVMAVNLFGRRSSFGASSARIVAAFGRDQVWALRPTREGNTIVIATHGVVVPDRAALAVRAATIERRFGLPARTWLRLVRPLE